MGLDVKRGKKKWGDTVSCGESEISVRVIAMA